MKYKKSFLLLGVAAIAVLPITTMACSWSVLGSKSTGDELLVKKDVTTYGKDTNKSKSYTVEINARWLSSVAVPGRNAHFQNVIWQDSKKASNAFWQVNKKASSNFADFATNASTKGFDHSANGIIPYLYTYKFNITVDQSSPFLTLATRFSPSPDWFGGFSALNLFKNGGWLTNYYYQMYVYSAAVKDQRFSDAGLIVKNKSMNVDPSENGKPFGTINIFPKK